MGLLLDEDEFPPGRGDKRELLGDLEENPVQGNSSNEKMGLLEEEVTLLGDQSCQKKEPKLFGLELQQFSNHLDILDKRFFS